MEQHLKKILASNEEGSSGSVYSHLTEVFTYILQNKSERLYENFESISAFVKKNTFSYNELKPDTEIARLEARKIELSD